MTKKNNYIILILTAITLIVVYACSLQQNSIVPITYYGYPDGFFDGAFSLDSEECMLKATEFYKYYLDLAEGAIILFSEDFSGDGANLKILAEILTNLSLENKHRIVITSLQTDFRGYFKEWLTPVFEEHNAIYGVDYVFLNSVGDVESFSQVCRTDWASAYNGVDHEGSSLDSLPLMASISKASDLDLVVCYASGIWQLPGYYTWLQMLFSTAEVNEIIPVFEESLIWPYDSANLKNVNYAAIGGSALDVFQQLYYEDK